MIHLLLGYILGIISVTGMTWIAERESKRRNGTKRIKL